MRKRCQRRRRDLDAHPVRLALLHGNEPVADADLHLLRTRERLALLDAQAGTLTADGWKALHLAARLAQALGRAGIGPEVLPYAQAALDVLAGRAAAAMSIEDVDALAALIELHDRQRAMASRAEFERAVWSVCGNG